MKITFSWGSYGNNSQNVFTSAGCLTPHNRAHHNKDSLWCFKCNICLYFECSKINIKALIDHRDDFKASTNLFHAWKLKRILCFPSRNRLLLFSFWYYAMKHHTEIKILLKCFIYNYVTWILQLHFMLWFNLSNKSVLVSSLFVREVQLFATYHFLICLWLCSFNTDIVTRL